MTNQAEAASMAAGVNMFKALILITALAASANLQTLAMTNGRTVQVQSYEVQEDGSVKAVSKTGRNMRFRVGRVDLDATAKLNPGKARPAKEAGTAPRAKPASMLDASHAAKAKGQVGGMSVTGSDYVPTGRPRARARNISRGAEPGTPGAGGGMAWKAQFDRLRTEYRAAKAELVRLAARESKLVAEHNAHADTRGGSIAEMDIKRAQLATLRDEYAKLKGKPALLKAEYARKQEQARRAGVRPIAWRQGIE